MERTLKKLIVIYTTRGEVGGFLIYPYIYDRQGEWIGWVTAERKIYSVHGHFVGYLTDEPRILRKISSDHLEPMSTPPARPKPINPPAILPLPPMMAEVPTGLYDVMDENSNLLPPIDSGEWREDMD